MTEQRAEFVALARQPGANRRAFCRHFGIAPATGYKWLQRYAAEGPAGLRDRSRRPHHSPAQTAPAIEQAVLALRVLLARQGVQPLPATSSITASWIRRREPASRGRCSALSIPLPTPCGRWTARRAGPAAPGAATP